MKENYKKDAASLIKVAQGKKHKDVKMLKSWTTDSEMKNTDGWFNVISGLGGSNDKSIYTTFQNSHQLPDSLLAKLWTGDGIAKRIVSCVTEDMLKHWFYIENDTDNILKNKIESLSLEKKLSAALNWKRLFGGSLIVLGINDGRKLYEEVNENTIKSVDWVRVFDRTQISITTMNFNQDIEDPGYGEIDFYTVHPVYGSPFNVHRSRCLEFKGVSVPDRVTTENYWYWGMSVLQPIWDQMKDLSSAYKNVGSLLYEIMIGVYKFAGLAQKLAEEGGEEKIVKRMQVVNRVKSFFNGIIMDSSKGEEFRRDGINTSNLPEILDRFMIWLSAVSGIPVTKLFGRSPAGENSTGEADANNYFDMVEVEQRTDLKPQLMKLIKYINMSKEIGTPVEDPVVVFNKLKQLSDRDIAEIRGINSKTDQAYVIMGALSAEEVRTTRFENGYVNEIIVEEGAELIEFEEEGETE